MNIMKILKERLEELQPLFDIENNKENQAKEEKLRLQGEYRLINKIINSEKKEEK